MLPVLKLAANGHEHKFSQAVEALADEFRLSTEERNELLPSGSQAVFNNRVGWARSYLKQAGLLSSPRRGFLKSLREALIYSQLIQKRSIIQYLNNILSLLHSRTEEEKKAKLKNNQKHSRRKTPL